MKMIKTNVFFRKYAFFISIFYLLYVPYLFSQKLEFDKYFSERNLRVDLLHTGNFYNEKIELHDIKSEPFWGGNPKNLIDTLNYGNYLLQLSDLETDQLIYSYGYGTLFQEWKFTKNAKKNIKSLEETLVMPMPLNTCLLEIFSRDSMNNFNPVFELKIDPDTVKKITSAFSPMVLVNNGNSNNKIDIVIVGDGYTKRDRKKLIEDAYFLINSLTSYRPFNEYKNQFNFVLVPAFSKQKGADDPSENEEVNTILNTSFNTLETDRYLMTESVWKLHDIVSCAAYDQIFILVNSKKYGGGAIYNFYSCSASRNKLSGFIMAHEFGHAFAGLADEYADDNSYDLYYSLNSEPWEPNITTLVDFLAKWKYMVADYTPIPTPANTSYISIIGAFEGAGYKNKGVYRPVFNCTMRSVSIDNFCPVCKNAITRMILYSIK